MNKIGTSILIIIMSMIVFFLSFDYKQKQSPNSYYKVYLKSEEIGVISSKQELENYIDKQNEAYKKKYGVTKVNAPNGLEIKKITTYNDKIDSTKEIYNKIVDKEDFTIPGVEFTLKNEDRKTNVYVTKREIFNQAVELAEKTFVGETDYNTYKETTQKEIKTTGKIINDIYLQENITVKSVNIPVTQKIYTDKNELSRYLVFGPDQKSSKYTVKLGDTLSSVAFDNQLSVEELLISNPSFTSEKNLLFAGQEIVINQLNPQITVVTEIYSVDDKVINYQTDYRYDPEAVKGDDKTIQVGENGLERLSQNIMYVNGNVHKIDIIKKQELKPATNEIVVKGEKDIPSVGSRTNWLWPTSPSGWSYSSGYGYRLLLGRPDFHTGMDIAITEGSPIYAVTNGVVIEASYRPENGIYVCINHNNGYYTCYNHMSKRIAKVGQIVARGDLIGRVGHTGIAYGSHLHLEVWTGYPWKCNKLRCTLDPRKMYPQVFGR